jgi:hypothetical protein
MVTSPPGEAAESPAAEPRYAPSRRGGVRWRRAAALGVPALLAGCALVVLTARGVLGIQMSVSGTPFTVTADRLQGQGFEQFGRLDPMAGQGGGADRVPAVVSAIDSASLTNLCQSVDLGATNLLIRAGTGAARATADHLTTDSALIEGDASFSEMEIGDDAGALGKAGVQGPLGGFGQQAATVAIDHLRQSDWATTAAVFKLPGLKLSFSRTGC